MSAVRIEEQILQTAVFAKKIDSQQQLLRELVGGVLFDEAQNSSLNLGVNNGRLITEKIEGIELALLWPKLSPQAQNQTLKNLALLLLKVKSTYLSKQVTVIDQLGGVISFPGFIAQNLQFLNSPRTRKLLGDNRGKLQANIESLLEIGGEKLSLIHGDLNLTNIIVFNDTLTLIDFEHVVEGPLELELAPMSFWADFRCLPLEDFRRELTYIGLAINPKIEKQTLALFLVNQLRLADEEGNRSKTRELLKIARLRQIIN